MFKGNGHSLRDGIQIFVINHNANASHVINILYLFKKNEIIGRKNNCFQYNPEEMEIIRCRAVDEIPALFDRSEFIRSIDRFMQLMSDENGGGGGGGWDFP